MRAEIKERIALIERGEVPEGYRKSKIGICPSDWECLHIDEIAELNPGKEKADAETVVTFLGMSDISDSAKVITPQEKKYAEVSNGFTAFRENDVLIAKITPCFENGKGALVRELKNGIGFGSTEFHVVRAKKRGDEIYIYLQSCSERFRKTGEKYMIGTAGQKRLPMDFISGFLIGYPKTDQEKNKIYEYIKTWDRAIELKEKLLEQKKLQKKGLIERLLTGKVRLPGFTDEWQYVKAGEIFGNSANKKHAGIGEVLSSMQDRGIVPRSQVDIDIKYDADSVTSYKKVEAGDFVISLRSFQGGIEYSEYEGLISPAYTVLKNKTDIDTGFYKELFKSANFIRRLNSVIYGIRDGKQIGYDDFSTLKLPYPPKAEQSAIAKVFQAANDQIAVLQNEITQLKTQKKGLMQLLLTGKVRVPC